MMLVLPQSTVRLIQSVAVKQRHQGLQLDKFSVPGDQTAQKTALTDVCQAPGEASLLTALVNRRHGLLAKLPGAVSFRCTTTGPLTLHLARASALENAGICLHPIYGFAYLPGSGLKGMARAYAEIVAQAPKEQIEAVFGNEPGEPKQERQRAGAIVFHDAWPESWPKLIVDIVNNHHPDYYGAAPDDNDHPPGDWENPVPVYFLAVKPGVTFTFPLAKRRADVTDELLELARQWLLGALCHLGAGAKTNAGYGAFKPAEDQPPPLPAQRRAVFETTLELVTPAFLAGANQQAEDCDLRPATLRGLLRWWWRTMHAGFLDVKTLRALEAAIWGDTHSGGAVRIVIEKISGAEPQLYDKGTKAKSDDNHKRSDYGIPSQGNPRKITPGLWYASYGMDEGGRNNRRQRHVLEPPASWRVRLIARCSRLEINGRESTAQQVLDPAQAALWLLCHFGGVGSKARKGFGSLAIDKLKDYTKQTCQNTAEQLRQQFGLSDDFKNSRAQSPSLEQMLSPVEVIFNWPNVWNVLDQVGFAYQAFAKKYKHKSEKMALGLPRRIGSPVQGTFNLSAPVTANGRHSSPVHIHVEGRPSNWTVRVIAFPAAHLPDLATSRKFLEEFLKDFGDDLRKRSQLSPPLTTSSGGAVPSRSTAGASSAAGPKPVRVRFLGPHDKLKNAFWVQEEERKRGLLKYGTRPKDLPAVDSEIEVYRTSDNLNAPEYRWDPPLPPNPPHRGSGGQRPRGPR